MRREVENEKKKWKESEISRANGSCQKSLSGSCDYGEKSVRNMQSLPQLTNEQGCCDGQA